MRYGIDDRPPFLAVLMYGLQWYAVSIPCVLIMGVVVAHMSGTGLENKIFFMQKIFMLMGLSVIVQVLLGHKLPLVIGPASVLLIGILATLSEGSASVNTALIIGGIIVSFIAFSGCLSKLQTIFTPRIIIVILSLIAFTLLPTIIRLSFYVPNLPATDGALLNNIQSDWFGKISLANLIFVLALVTLLIVLNKILAGVFKSLVVLLGLIIGTLTYKVLLFCLMGELGLDLLGGASFSIDLNQASLDLSLTNFFAHFFKFEFELNIPVLISFLFCFLALIINDLGSIQAVGEILKAPNISQRVKKGVGLTGISNTMCGLCGVIGPVDFSMSPGIIFATGCASRFTLIPAALLLIFSGFIPSFIMLLTTIPEPVMGALLLYLMGAQVAAALKMCVDVKAVCSFEHGLIIGLAMLIALLISFAPLEAILAIPSVIRPIVGNGFVMGVIAVVILEHLIFKNKQL